MDDVCGSFLAWKKSPRCGGLEWKIHSTLHSHDTASIFSLIFPDNIILMTTAIDSMLHQIDFVGMDTMFIPYQCGYIMDWLSQMVPLIMVLATSGPRFTQA